MSLNFKDAKTKAKKEDKDWRDLWKYGGVVRGMTQTKGASHFIWGPKATKKQKGLLTDLIDSPSKWASKVEHLLDDPPSDSERKALKRLMVLRK